MTNFNSTDTLKVIQIDTNVFACQPTVGQLLGALARHHPMTTLTKTAITGHGDNTWVVCFTAMSDYLSSPQKRVGVVKWDRVDGLYVTNDVIA